PTGVASLGVVFAGVLGAIGWNLLTWYFGLPSSSSHAPFGGLVGATLFAAGGTVQWGTIVDKVLLPLVLSPLVRFVRGAVVLCGLLWVIKGLTVAANRTAAPAPVPVATAAAPASEDGELVDGEVVAPGGAEPSDARGLRRLVQPGPLNRTFRRLQTV